MASGNGVEVSVGQTTLRLDPKRRAAGHAFVTHGHTDHLMPDARMTPPTLDFLRIRKPASSGTALGYHKRIDVEGVGVTLRDAGHVLGSAMVHLDTAEGSLLYTGDFSTTPSLLCGAAQPVECDVLVTESTYGDPRFELPPRDLVLASIEAWMLNRLVKGPVAFGAYPLGRAQEMVAVANQAGITPIVSPDIAAITAVYNAHGHDLTYAVTGTERARDLEPSGAMYVVPREWLKQGHDFARGLRSREGAAAYLSGWCHQYSYFNTYDIDVQFSLSDHAGFNDLVAFVDACRPKRVYTMHGSATTLARELRKRLGVQAERLAPARKVPVVEAASGDALSADRQVDTRGPAPRSG